MRRKARSRDFLGKFSALTLALILLLSIFVPLHSGVVNAQAATSTITAGQTITIHLSDAANGKWTTPMQVRYLSSSGTVLATQSVTLPTTSTPVSITVPAAAAGATSISVDNLISTKVAIANEIDTLEAAAGTNQRLVLYDNTSSNWSSVYYYTWKSSTNNGAWPGVKMTNTLTSNSKIYYVYVDTSTYSSIIFNNGASDGSVKTADLTIPTTSKNFYSSATNSWSDYTAIQNSATLSFADRAGDSLNHLYLTGEKTAEWSKYGDTYTMKRIYFKPNSTWTTAYVHYDDDDPLDKSIQMTVYNNDPLIYYADVPVGAMVSFSTGPDYDESAKKASGAVYDGSDTLNTYVMAARQWDTLANALTKDTRESDYTVTANNFSSATPSITGSKIVGVNATYYDYLSNNELTSGWRNNLNDDTNYVDSYRLQFNVFNNVINDIAKEDTSWRYPMYFGDDYNYGYYIDGFYNSVGSTRNPGITQDYFRAVNNANALGGYNRSILGLVQPNLNNGDLMVTSTTKAPWFDYETLQGDPGGEGTQEALKILTSNSGTSYRIAIPRNYEYIKISKASDSGTLSADLKLSTDISGKIIYTDADSGAINNFYTGTDSNYGSSSYDDNYWYVVIVDNKNWGGVKAHFWNTAGATTTWPGLTVNGTTYDDPAGTTSVTSSGPYAKVINSQFPFVATTDSNGVTTYTFDSTDATDNVYFTWDTDTDNSSIQMPTQVNYGAGSTYGVKNKTTNSGTYGFFPFNKAGDTVRDYGFGLRMDMEFTLPMNGVFGNSNVTPAADEIWIQNTSISNLQFGTPNTTGSYVPVSGYSTATGGDGKSYIVIKKSNSQIGTKTHVGWTSGSWHEIKLASSWGHAFTNLGVDVNQPATFEYSGDDDLWVFIDGQLVLDLGGAHTPTTGSINFGAGVDTISSTADSVYAEMNTPSDVSKGGASVTKTFSINNSDTSRKHTMTVFYMERGTNDSNLKVAYTIQPVLNELEVEKEVKVGDVNSAIVGQVTSEALDTDFGFTLKQDGALYGSSTSKNYVKIGIHDDTETLTVDDGTFELKHYEVALFSNDQDLTYGSALNIKESAPSVFQYSTQTEVTDLINGTIIKSKADESTSGTSFDFKNLHEDGTTSADEKTAIKVDYINTLKTADLTLSKDVVKEDGTTASTSNIPFTFLVEIDLDGDGTKYGYEAYNLEYELITDEVTAAATYAADGGYVSIRPDQTVKFVNIPVGAKYRITESSTPGYEIGSISGGTSTGYITEGTIGATGTAVTYTNKEKPADSNVQVQKKLDGQLYSGTDFEFTAELIRRDGNTTTLTADELAQLYPIDTIQTIDNNGVGTFRAFEVIPNSDNVGKYVFEIKEKATAADSLYVYDKTVYYAVLEVKDGTLSKPTYYTDSACTTTVGSTGEYPPTFNNTTATKYTNISFVKTDDDGQPLGGAEFTLYTDEACETMGEIATVSKEGLGFVNPATSAASTGSVQFTGVKYEPAGRTASDSTVAVNNKQVAVGDIVKVAVVIDPAQLGDVNIGALQGHIQYNPNVFEPIQDKDNDLAYLKSLNAFCDVNYTADATDSSGDKLVVYNFASGNGLGNISAVTTIAEFTFKVKAVPSGGDVSALTLTNVIEDCYSKDDTTGTDLAATLTNTTDFATTAAKYYIKETKAKNRYQLLTGTIMVDVLTDGTYKLFYKSTDDGAYAPISISNGTYAVQNVAQPDLPKAGGIGVTMFYTVGALLVAFVAVVFYVHRRRRLLSEV